jgi:hypothetical protein
MSGLAGSVLAGLLVAGASAAAWAQSGPKERECMRGEQRIDGECQPVTRGPKNKGSGSS